MNVPRIDPSSIIGARVEIADSAVIGPNCRLSGRTSVGARAQLRANVRLSDAQIGDDCVLDDGVRIDAGSVVDRGLHIGMHTHIEAGSFVGRAIQPYAIAQGDPAVVRGFVTTSDLVRKQPANGKSQARSMRIASQVAGVALYTLPSVEEPRGTLSFAELGREIPFDVKRFFIVRGVPQGELRGEHAHTRCEELLVCVAGSLTVLVDDGSARQEFVLDHPGIGLHIPRLIWTIQYRHSPDAMLVVLASTPYEASDYIKDYETFLVRRQTAA